MEWNGFRRKFAWEIKKHSLKAPLFTLPLSIVVTYFEFGVFNGNVDFRASDKRRKGRSQEVKRLKLLSTMLLGFQRIDWLFTCRSQDSLIFSRWHRSTYGFQKVNLQLKVKDLSSYIQNEDCISTAFCFFSEKWRSKN